jgi:hypothetical protein
MSSANQYAKHVLLIFTYRSTFLQIPAKVVVALSNIADHRYIQVRFEVWLVAEVVATDNCEATPGLILTYKSTLTFGSPQRSL